MMASQPAGGFSTTRLVILVADLSGYHRGFRTHSDEVMAEFLDQFYRAAASIIEERDGRVIKFLGDAVLAVFDDGQATSAVSAATALETASASIASDFGLDLSLGANVHVGEVVSAELGTGDSRKPDVIGRVVNQTFLLGRGRGIRISERVYRQLPSSDRAVWDKRKPPTLYVLGGRA